MTNNSPLSKKEKSLTPFTFSLPCPHCQATLTPQDFDNNHFTIAHLQAYFSQKESEYKSLIRQQLEQEISSLPAYQTLQKENQELKLLVEGYKLGTTKASKTKGEELEKYITEQLQATYNGADDISKITHVGTKADISQIVHYQGQTIGTIIYEIKNDSKWDPKWLEKLEKDMVSDKANFGILVATCRSGQPLWKPYPPKNILVSDEDNFIFASQMARLLVISQQRLQSTDNPSERIKSWDTWIREKLPNYLLRLEKFFSEWEKDIGRINTSVKSMEKVKEEMRKVLLEEMERELKSI